MGKVRVVITMSLDGFINDRNGRVGALYPDMAELHKSVLFQEWLKETGAVMMGRRTYAMAPDPDSYADAYEFQVPIFVVTQEAPRKRPKENDRLTFTFVGDIQSAIAQAKAAAGDRRVMVVGGAHTIQHLLRAGLVDELDVGIVPVLLGEGLRLFDLGAVDVSLEKMKVVETGARTDIFFRVVKKGRLNAR